MVGLAIVLFLAYSAAQVMVVSLAHGARYEVERGDPAYAARLYFPEGSFRRGAASRPIRGWVLLFGEPNEAAERAVAGLRLAYCSGWLLLVLFVIALTKI